MASPNWRRARSLKALLIEEPQRFDIRQAVRLLEAMMPEAVPVGLGNNPAAEAITFRGTLGTGFPASDIDRIVPEPDGYGRRSEMTVNCLSLAGAFGPLPPPMADLIAERARHHDTASRDFLDIFNHRLISLAIRSWRLFRVGLQPFAPEETSFAACLFSAMGLGTAGLRVTSGRHPRNRLHGLDRSLLMFAGLLNQRPVSLHAVERMLAVHFGRPVRASPLRGAWQRLDPDQLTSIGESGRNRRLGSEAMIGSRLWDQEAGILLACGPMRYTDFISLLPGNAPFAEVKALVQFALGKTFDVQLKLILQPGEMPVTRLTAKAGLRLGWTAWLNTRTNTSPVSATVPLIPDRA